MSRELDTRGRILEATRKLMVERRGTGVPMRAIAERAGISRQALYLHFGSRADLLVATTRHLDRQLGLQERIGATRQAPGGRARLDAFIDFWGRYMPEIHGIAKALMASRESDPDAAVAWNERMQAVRGECRAVLEVLQREGMLKGEWTLDPATDLLSTLLSIGSWEQLTVELGWTTDRYVATMQALARRTFVKG